MEAVIKYKLFFLLLSVFLFSCGYETITPYIEEDIALPEKPLRHELTLIAAGDNLFHITLINKSFDEEKDQYNFYPIYSEIKEIIENADLSFINQETVMAGESFGYSGYPLFNTPQSLARTLADTGFDILNIANNHTMDMGRAGLLATLDLLEKTESVTVLGARKEGESHKIIAKNSIKLGFLSYTYGLNGHALPADSPNLVSLINREKIKKETEALRPLCDFLIVSMHWGDEYLLIEPDKYQKDLAVFLAEQNVDLIIGHHPHVLQRVETLERRDGGKTLCFYSIGNFASHQREKERVLGGIMLATFIREGEDLFISNSGLIPVICHFEPGYVNTKVYPIFNYNEELLGKHLLRFLDSDMDFDFFHSVLRRLETKIIMYNPFN
ncbi:MAG: CapA family protein [Treponema sp.]|nr:CapA family protein [Treponema sp.]